MRKETKQRRLSRAVADDELPREVLHDLLEGRLAFRPDLIVSKQSYYGDALWDWRDASNPRLSVHCPAELSIDWARLQSKYNLGREIIEDLKRFAFLRIAHSPHFFPSSKKNAHPSTVTDEINIFSSFLSHIRNELSVDGHHFINRLSDIEVQDLRDALSTYNKGCLKIIKRVLKFLASPAMRISLSHGPLIWKVEDVDTLDWKPEQRRPTERLPSDLFRLLSNSATKDVKHFLQALGIETKDTTRIGEGPNTYLSAYENFKSLYEGYREARINYRQGPNGPGRNMYVRFKRGQAENGMRHITDLVDRARSAAMTILTMYMGGRDGELSLLTRGCLRRDGDQWVILGTHVKHEDVNKPANRDKWVATPIMRDAVRVLEEICPSTGSDYLFHGRFKNQNHRPMSPSKIALKLTTYLRLIDINKEWEERDTHPQQFRNSLAFELRKAGLGLPFITFQLKHAYYAMEYPINNVTLSYGGIGRDACVTEVHNANLEALRDIFHPDSPVAGGGAEQHKKRRAAYFQGMALHGINPDEVLKRLAQSGSIPLTDVGAGLCLGQRVIVVDGVKTDPPCIGELRCNPVRCPNGIIPEHKVPMWKRIAKENRRRVQDPEFFHARRTLEEAAEEAEAVVNFFQPIADKSRNG